MTDTFRDIDFSSPNGSVPLHQPANWPHGSFLYYRNARKKTILAEGVLPGANAGAERSAGDQQKLSKPYNAFEPTREQRKTDPSRVPSVTKIHAGHLIPHFLGGSGEAYNLIPTTQNVNVSRCKRVENQLANKIRHGDIYLQVYVTYPVGRDFPLELRYVAYEMDGNKARAQFLDETVPVPNIWN